MLVCDVAHGDPCIFREDRYEALENGKIEGQV